MEKLAASVLEEQQAFEEADPEQQAAAFQALHRENKELRTQQQSWVRGHGKFMGGGQFRAPKKCEECAERDRLLRELQGQMKREADTTGWEQRQCQWQVEKEGLQLDLKNARQHHNSLQGEIKELQVALKKSAASGAQHADAIAAIEERCKRELQEHEDAWKKKQAGWEQNAKRGQDEEVEGAMARLHSVCRGHGMPHCEGMTWHIPAWHGICMRLRWQGCIKK